MTHGQPLQRWSTFAAIFLANMLPEFLWSNFPPIVTLVQARYGIGESTASLPIIMFSVGTVLSAGAAGRLIDRRGYRFATLLGLAMAALFALMRMVEGPFWFLVVAQGGIGAAFSFVAAASASYVADWFDGRRAALMSGLCVIGLYVGLGSSMVITPIMVERLGFAGTMRITALAAVAIFAVACVMIRTRRTPERMALPAKSSALRGLLHNRALVLLFVISYLTGGLFSAVATALEPIWSLRRFTPEQAGLANGLFILGGIFGSFLMPLLQTWTRDARAVLILCSVAILLLTYPLLVAPSLLVGDLIAVALGVFWMGNIPVCYTLLEQAAGSARAGTALSGFWAINSVGSVTLVWMFTAVMERTSWQSAAAITLALLSINLVVAVALPRTAARQIGRQDLADP